ncbi:putative methyltransferase-domain-containing protein [Whalleya microplaca]|nr:putative methyltransferase-domain-containing protein [Whalleya microplaca]
MHYIRLLRPARFDLSDSRRPFLSLLITITTDLGDSFLYPDEPIELALAVEYFHDDTSFLLSTKSPARWSAGMRVLECKIPMQKRLVSIRQHISCDIKIYAAQSRTLGYMESSDALPWTVKDESPASEGLIVPVHVFMENGVCRPVTVRLLRLVTGSQDDDVAYLYLQEEIGESIARHVWDAGVVTSCFLADSCRTKDAIHNILPIQKNSISVLELGCGAGILGISIASIMYKAAAVQGQQLKEAHILLTDLPEAETHTRSNINEASSEDLSIQRADGHNVALKFESLDWDAGKQGQFGPLVSSRAWDFIVLSDCTYNVDSLPALVGTLSALHAANLRHVGTDTSAKSSVILATKPRHSSEQALFGFLKADEWRYRLLKSIPLPRLGEGAEVVEIYLLEKGKGMT